MGDKIPAEETHQSERIKLERSRILPPSPSLCPTPAAGTVVVKAREPKSETGDVVELHPMNRGRLLDHETEGAQLVGVHGESVGTVEDSSCQLF